MSCLFLKKAFLPCAALAGLFVFACSSDEAVTAPSTPSCPVAEVPCFFDSTNSYVLYGDAYLYPGSSQGDLIIYKETRIVTDAEGNPVGMLNNSGNAIIDNLTGEPIVQMLKLGELSIVTPYIPPAEESGEIPDTSSPAPDGKYKMLHNMAWLLHGDKDYLIYGNGEVSDANCNVVGTITDHFGGDIVDPNGKAIVENVNAGDLDVVIIEDNIACPARPASSSSSKPASSASSSSKKAVSSSSSSKGGGSTSTGCPNIQTKGGGGSGWATRYWDCCKPSCSWNENAGGKLSRQCTNKGRSQDTNYGNGSVCDGGGSAMTCISQIPFTVDGCSDMAFAFAAVPASNGGQCGKCFQLTFTGAGHYNSTNSNTNAIKGKKLIIMVTNVGHDVEQGQFDIMIPGGGVGAFNGCASMGWGNQGQQYGGLLSDCETETGYNANSYQECLRNKCNSAFSSDSDAKKGCLFLAEFMHAAGNPEHNYVEVECPNVLKDKY
jgi:hypothetical protein